MPAIKRTYSTVGGSQSTGRVIKRSRTMPYKRRIPRGITTLGRIAGKISPSTTTLARSIGPFSERKYVTFEYKNASYPVSGNNLMSLPVMLNSMYDFDKTGSSWFGNKQPLYYDQLLSGSGPYKTYKVISWVTTYTIMNTGSTPLQVWALPPTSSSSELDTAAEADNFPGVQSMILTPLTGSKCMGTITVRGHVKDVYPSYSDDSGLTGPFNGDPGSPIYGGLLLYYIDGTSTILCNVAVKHEAYTELGLVDSIVS